MAQKFLVPIVVASLNRPALTAAATAAAPAASAAAPAATAPAAGPARLLAALLGAVTPAHDADTTTGGNSSACYPHGIRGSPQNLNFTL